MNAAQPRSIQERQFRQVGREDVDRELAVFEQRHVERLAKYLPQRGVDDHHGRVQNLGRVADQGVFRIHRPQRLIDGIAVADFDSFGQEDVVAAFAEDAVQVRVANEDVFALAPFNDVVVDRRMRVALNRRVDLNREVQQSRLRTGRIERVGIEDAQVIRARLLISQIQRGNAFFEHAAVDIQQVGAHAVTVCDAQPRRG